MGSGRRGEVRMLVLAVTGRQPPDAELRRLIAGDLMPDVMLAEEAFGASSLDDRDLLALPGLRGRVLRGLPVQLALALEAWRRRGEFDVVLGWTERLGFSLAALLALTPRRRIGHIAVFSWPVDASTSSQLRQRVKHVAFPWLAQRGVDRLVIPAARQRELVMERWRIAPTRILGPGWPVDTRFWRPHDGGGETICAVGREMRDYETLIEALRPLRIPCHIATGASVLNPAAASDDPRARNASGRELPAGVTAGAKSALELRELYARSRFVVVPLMPTETDNGTTAIIEAMAMGRAVVVTHTVGRAEILEDEVNCVSVAPRDVPALRAAIERLWNDPDLCARLGANGRERVVPMHGIEQWLATIRKAASELASGARLADHDDRLAEA